MRTSGITRFGILLLFGSVVHSMLNAQDVVMVGDLRVEQPWARASIGTSRPAAAYVRIANGGMRSDRLLSLQSPIAGLVEIHRSVSKGNVMRMEPVGTLVIAPGDTMTLKPGGMHIMLMKLKKPLKRGGSFPLVMKFEKAGRIELKVPVFGPGSPGPR